MEALKAHWYSDTAFRTINGANAPSENSPDYAHSG
ncbi:hypothetical protein V5J35_004396 [Endozoicomonas sp. NE40]|uniref:Uncharacterized protein n=1 Tax=Endozoicomonas lisbonensis TaxID=3120522 RepID=A0ABV2SN59_9GAMM